MHQSVIVLVYIIIIYFSLVIKSMLLFLAYSIVFIIEIIITISAGPIKQTVVDFWRLVWQERCEVIVMVTNLVDGGKTKCEQYWPSLEQKTQEIKPFIISLLTEKVFPDFILRTMRISVSNRQLIIN